MSHRTFLIPLNARYIGGLSREEKQHIFRVLPHLRHETTLAGEGMLLGGVWKWNLNLFRCDDWNSGDFHPRCVCARSEILWKTHHHHHRIIPWINFNQFGWVHSNAEANIEAFFVEMAMICARLNLAAVCRRRWEEEASSCSRANKACGIFDFVVFHLPALCSKRLHSPGWR